MLNAVRVSSARGVDLVRVAFFDLKDSVGLVVLPGLALSTGLATAFLAGGRFADYAVDGHLTGGLLPGVALSVCSAVLVVGSAGAGTGRGGASRAVRDIGRFAARQTPAAAALVVLGSLTAYFAHDVLGAGASLRPYGAVTVLAIVWLTLATAGSAHYDWSRRPGAGKQTPADV